MRVCFFAIFFVIGTFFCMVGYGRAEIVTTNITAVINEDYAELHPEWKERVLEAVDYVNSVFAKTTNARFRVSNFYTYSYDRVEKWASLYESSPSTAYLQVAVLNESYYEFRTDLPVEYATAIFYYIPTDPVKIDQLLTEFQQGVPAASAGVHTQQAEGEKRKFMHAITMYHALRPESEPYHPLLSREYLNETHGLGSYEDIQNVIAHEIAHTFGVANPEYYLLHEFYDYSGVEPMLPTYRFNEHYGYDPMNILYRDESVYAKFSELSSYIINTNIYRQDFETYYNIPVPSVRVQARNRDGSAIANAEVQVYGVRTGCRQCLYDPSINPKDRPTPLLQTVYTDADGYAYIKPASTEWRYTDKDGPLDTFVAKAVKVYYNGEGLAQYLTFYELQKDKIINGSDVYTMLFEFSGNGSETVSQPPAAEAVVGSPNDALIARLSGRILLQVQEHGEAWYLDPVNLRRHYMGRPSDAFNLMRSFGLGISNADLDKIPVAVTDTSGTDTDADGLSDDFEVAIGSDIHKRDTDGDGYDDRMEAVNGYSLVGSGRQHSDAALRSRLRGRILLQVERNGEAWYIDPSEEKRYFLGRPADAFAIMRALGLGITNMDLGGIPTK